MSLSWTKQKLLDECLKLDLPAKKTMTKAQLLSLFQGNKLVPTTTSKGKNNERARKGNKDGSDLLTAFTTDTTGIRDGEMILGVRNVSSNAVLRVFGGTIPPYKKSLDLLRTEPVIWQRFLEKLGSIEFFTSLSLEERARWLQENQVAKEIDISEIPNISLEIVSLGNSDFLKLPDKDIDSLLQGQRLDASQVRALFPGKPGSKAKRHTLIFLRSFWKISVSFNTTNFFDGLTFDLNKMEILNQAQAKLNQTILTFETPACAFLIETKTVDFTEEGLNQILLKLFDNFTNEDIKQVRSGFEGFTPAGYKSLLQKIIRFRPSFVKIGQQNIEASFVLAVTFISLMLHPGSFVPDIQRYVSGFESATKRLAVTILEDSFCAKEMQPYIMQLLISAFLAQRVKSFRPTVEMVEDWIMLCQHAWTETRYFDYNLQTEKVYTLSTSRSYLEYASVFLNLCKSFPGDLAMFADIATNFDSITRNGLDQSYPEIMPVIHCLDQHWAPDIAYMYDVAILKKLVGDKIDNFEPLFRKLFQEVTGMNPRKHDFANFEERPFVKASRLAQEKYLATRTNIQRLRQPLAEQVRLDYTLDRGFIAGMLGVVEIKTKPSRYVTLKPNQIETLVVVRRPTRDMKTAELTQQEEESAKQEVLDLLEHGLPLNATEAPIKELVKAQLALKNGKYYILRNKTLTLWDKVRESRVIIPLYKPLVKNFKNAISWIGHGLESNADREFEALIESTPARYVLRAYTYLNNYKTEIELNRLSRDGTGVKQSVSIDDIGAYNFLLQICLLYPGALRLVEGTTLKFKLPEPRLLWRLQDYVGKIIYENNVQPIDQESVGWGNLMDRRKRKLWLHQSDSLQDMISRHEAGKRGQFLWLPVGLGKTLVVMKYLVYLNSIQQLPRNIIYTLPSSAITSVSKEIQDFFGKQVVLNVPLKSIKNHPLAKKITINQGCGLIDFHVTLIEHDHLRKCREELLPLMASSVFIIDEVHKALNETQRTSVALELSKLSFEFIALTGTPVIDNKTYKLIWWLEQIVAFPVNEKNFWVASNSMIAKRQDTGIDIDLSTVPAKFTPTEQKKYSQLVSTTLGGTNPSPSIQDFQHALQLCYQASTRQMIHQIDFFLQQQIRVMVVAQNSTHQAELQNLCISQLKINSKDIFMLTGKDSIYLTDEAVEKGQVYDYKIVIVTLRKSEGYTLTRLGAMVTSVYPSNNATREQLAGRINRIGQSAKTIYFRIVMVGLLDLIYEKHRDASNISAVLKTLAQNIN